MSIAHLTCTRARFTFSFWHQSVCLWDVVPAKNRPSVAILEGLRQSLMQPAHLRKALRLWWKTRRTVCLEHLQWDPQANEVVRPKTGRPGALAIQSAHFDADEYRTILHLTRTSEAVEIAL
ncbi:MAG TPA: hypothetical protein VFK31_12195 [Rhodanobacteraceae bacterium]|nr:hypothetical protein [Rhodanobacteraceae bacterium]